MFTALNYVYSKDASTVDEKREVLQLLTCFHLLYNVALAEDMAEAWRR